MTDNTLSPVQMIERDFVQRNQCTWDILSQRLNEVLKHPELVEKVINHMRPWGYVINRRTGENYDV